MGKTRVFEGNASPKGRVVQVVGPRAQGTLRSEEMLQKPEEPATASRVCHSLSPELIKDLWEYQNKHVMSKPSKNSTQQINVVLT